MTCKIIYCIIYITRGLARYCIAYACFYWGRVENVTNRQTHIGGWVKNVTNGRTDERTGEKIVTN